MIFIFIILPLLAIVIILIALGKPINIDYKINKLLESFEKTDYKKDGKIKRDYLVWNNSGHTIKIDYSLFYKFGWNPFNWKSKISVKLNNVKLPDDFQITLKKNNNERQEYSFGYTMDLTDGNHFLVKIYQINNYIDLSQPQPVKFDIIVIVEGTNIRETINYEFLIGEDLGESWVALDPGTTATTIAFGNDNTDIIIAKNKEGETLTPSVLVFDKKNVNNSFYGDEAVKIIGDADKYLGFRSIKKLLGFKDIKEIGKNGKELASKLVSDIFNDVKQVHTEIQRAKRAIVAIPNNYTATKIKDMLACIENLGQFKEIRTIYEAEAIIFYYLSNKSALEENFSCKNTQSDETILVFDMGGATINATVAQISKQNEETYEVNILSKIGYGIGGDSIDYCILKSIFDFVSEISDLQNINIFDETVRKKMSEQEYKEAKEKLIALSFRIKLEIIKNKNKTELISASDLQGFLSDAISKDIHKKINIYIDVESNFYRIFKSRSKFCILKNQYFTKLIYNNVNDAITEVLKIAGNPEIDKIILSGRSSSFPGIANNINDSFSYTIDMIDLNKNGAAKTAVAEGACWYGLSNNCIKLNNLKTSANFGFVKTKSLDKQDIEFINLIETGQNFIDKEQGNIKSVQKAIGFRHKFLPDRKVKFYQVMGSDAEKIIAEKQQHKYSRIATVQLQQESEEIEMIINENDDVNCLVRLVSGKTEKLEGVVADQEIADANEEHYTWIVN